MLTPVVGNLAPCAKVRSLTKNFAQMSENCARLTSADWLDVHRENKNIVPSTEIDRNWDR